MAKSKKDSESSHDDIVSLARERFRTAEQAEADLRKDALDDIEFRSGNQWPLAVKNERTQDARPCLVINRIPQFVRQITNDQRQNRPSIKVSPVDDKATVETAKVLEGLIRHIEYNSGADSAYDWAFSGAVQGGFGYFRIITDYSDPMSFDQEILIKRVRDHFSVYLDPFHKESDGSDAKWGFIFEDVAIEDYKADYPDSEVANTNDWENLVTTVPGWVSEKTVRVAEYFYIDFKSVDIVQLSSGETVEKDKLPSELPPNVSVVKERKTQVPVVKWCKINGLEILEETTWPGSYIPIIPVYGDEIYLNGKKTLEGIIRHAKDPQRMYNYWASSETESIALAPRAPFIVAEGQITEDYEAAWNTANKKNHSYLPYKPTSINGQPVPPPQRNTFEPAVQAITNARAQSADDLKATTGIYDAALGSMGVESSGVAIQRRNAQSQTSNFHFVDNLTRSLRHAGRILIEIIPKVYDSVRAARIIGEDDQQEIILINQLFKKENGDVAEYNLDVGKYDVTVSTGPSYQTKRQEAVASMIDLMRAAPQAMAPAMDLFVKAQDWPLSQEISDRIKKTMPPQLVADSKDQNSQIPPQVQQQLQQQDQMIQQLTQHLQGATQDLKTKRLELESKERIAFSQMQNNLVRDEIKAKAETAVTLFEHELAQINKRLDLLHAGQSIDESLNGSDPSQGLSQPNQQPPMQASFGAKPPLGAPPAPGGSMNQQPTGGSSPGSPMGG